LRIADPRGHEPRIKAALKSQRKWGFEGGDGNNSRKDAEIAKGEKVIESSVSNALNKKRWTLNLWFFFAVLAILAREIS
jgi:hypothetical protein